MNDIALRLDFDCRLKLESHDLEITPDAEWQRHDQAMRRIIPGAVVAFAKAKPCQRCQLAQN